MTKVHKKTAVKRRMREAQRPPQAGGKPPPPPPDVPESFDFSRADQLCKELANDEVVIRDKALAETPAYLNQALDTTGPQVTLECAKVWRGLFYCMWHSDKALVQLECAERIASLTETVPAGARAEWVSQGWKTLEKEWHSIDRWRVEKYYALMRRMLNRHLRALAAASDPAPLLESMREAWDCSRKGIGCHLSDCLVDECIAVQLPHELFTQIFTQVLLYVLKRSTSKMLRERLLNRVFARLSGQMTLAEESEEALKWLADTDWETVGEELSTAAVAQDTLPDNRDLIVRASERVDALLQNVRDIQMLEEVDSDEEFAEQEKEALRKQEIEERKAAPGSVAAKAAARAEKRRAQRNINKAKKTGDSTYVTKVAKKAIREGVAIKKRKKLRGKGRLDQALAVADDGRALAKQQKMRRRKRRV